MNFKRTFLISLFLLIIITGVVSAADTSDDLSIDDSGQDSTDIAVDEALSVSDDDAVRAKQQIDLDNYIAAPNSTEVKACQQNYFHVNLPSDATGNMASIVDEKLDDNYDLVDGAVTIPFKFDSFGLHNINLTYNGDANYGRTSKLYTFNVTDFKMGVTYPDEIYYGKESTLYVDLPKDVKGSLHLNLNDNFYHSVSSLSGDYEFPIYNLKYGENKFTIEYQGGNYHNDVVKGSFIAIPLIDIPIYAQYNEEYEISLTLPSNAAGSLVVNFDGNLRTSKVKNGKAVISVGTIRDFDYHNITAYYDGSDYDVEPAVYVLQVAPVIKYSKVMWTEGNNSISFKAPGPGTLKYSVDGGATTKLSLADGETAIPLSGLDVGSHSIYLDYKADNSDYQYTVTETFEVRGENPSFDLELDFVNETRVCEPFDIRTNIPSNGDGILYYYIDGQLAPYVVSWGFSTIAYVDPSELSPGTHTVKLQYCNDSYYKDVTKTTKFSVVDVKIVIPQAIDYGQNNGYVDVYITENVTGNITVYVDGKRFKTMPITPAYYGIDSFGYCYRLDLENLKTGTHQIKVAYSGDNNYPAKTRTSDVAVSNTTVEPEASYAIFKYEECTYDEPGYVYLELPSNATGNMVVTIDDLPYKTEKLINGKANVTISIKGDWGHNVKVTYDASDYSFSKDLYWYAPILTYTTPEYKGENMSVRLPKDALGQLRVWINGKTYYLSIINGYATFIPDNVAIGENEFSIYYSDDDVYGSYDDDGFFNVNAKASIGNQKVPLNYHSFYYQRELKYINVSTSDNLIIDLESDFNGEYVVAIGQDFYAKGSFVNGVASIPLANAKPGFKEIYVDYEYQTGKHRSIYSFAYIDNPPELTVDVLSTVNAKKTYVYVTANEAITNVSVIVNGVGYNVKLVNGSGRLKLTGLTDGEYVATAVYDGDARFSAQNVTKTFNVKIDPVIITTKDVFVGEDVKIGVDVGDSVGKVILNVNDKEYNLTLVKGKASQVISKLAAGEYKVTAKFLGIENFFGNVNSTSVIVKKYSPELTVSVMDTINAKRSYVYVTADKSITKVSLIVGDYDYNVKLVNGSGKLKLTDLTDGDYVATAVYDGSAKFSAQNASKPFKVKIASVIITAPSVFVGEDALVTVNVGDSVGKVILNVNNVEYNLTLVDGNASQVISNLNAGKYKISAKFLGIENFYGNVNSSSLVVQRYSPGLNVNVVIGASGKNTNINVAANKGINDNVIVNVNGVDYTVKLVNGSGKLSLPNLGKGTYKVNVSYDGDDRFVAQNATKTFRIYAVEITPKASSAWYTGTYSVTVYGADGKVAANKNVIFYINGKNVKSTTTDKNGVASFKLPAKYVPKKYTIKTMALSKTITKKNIPVKQIITAKTTKFKKSAKKATITVTLKKVDGKFLKGKTVKLRINGKTYTKKTTSKGVAKFTIKKSVLKKLRAGSKYIYKVTYSKTYIRKVVKVTR